MKNLSVLNNAEAARALGQLMQDQGHTLVNTLTVLEAVDRMGEEPWDVLIPSYDLGNMTGMDLIKQLRESRNPIPILVLDDEPLEDTPRAERSAACLDAGADDYVGHAHTHEEVLARVKALGRRVRHHSRIDVAGPLAIDYHYRQVLVAGTHIFVTSREYALMEVLMQNKGIACSRTRLCSVLGGKAVESNKVLDLLIYRLRKKIRGIIGDHAVIDTCHGIGYRIIL